jgi:hypothetical protein
MSQLGRPEARQRWSRRRPPSVPARRAPNSCMQTSACGEDPRANSYVPSCDVGGGPCPGILHGFDTLVRDRLEPSSGASGLRVAPALLPIGICSSRRSAASMRPGCRRRRKEPAYDDDGAASPAVSSLAAVGRLRAPLIVSSRTARGSRSPRPTPPGRSVRHFSTTVGPVQDGSPPSAAVFRMSFDLRGALPIVFEHRADGWGHRQFASSGPAAMSTP